MSKDLILDTIETMREYLPKLITASETIAEDIQSHEGGWLETLIAYLEGLGWVTMAISGIQQLDQEIIKNMSVDALAPLLEKMKDALERSDYVAVCDLLQYELQPLLKEYNEELMRVNE